MEVDVGLWNASASGRVEWLQRLKLLSMRAGSGAGAGAASVDVCSRLKRNTARSNLWRRESFRAPRLGCGHAPRSKGFMGCWAGWRWVTGDGLLITDYGLRITDY